MLRENSQYRRLKAGSRSPLGSSSYWLAADHLLVVEVAGISERYRRFDLREIRAVALTPAPTRLVWNLIFGGLLLPVLGIGALGLSEEMANSFSDPGGWVALLIVASIGVVLLVAMLLNMFRGKGGHLTLTTAVQTIRLPGMGRWRRAEELLIDLEPLIRAAQAALPSPVATERATEPPSAPAVVPIQETSS